MRAINTERHLSSSVSLDTTRKRVNTINTLYRENNDFEIPSTIQTRVRYRQFRNKFRADLM